jgi:hypothetical protein
MIFKKGKAKKKIDAGTIRSYLRDNGGVIDLGHPLK